MIKSQIETNKLKTKVICNSLYPRFAEYRSAKSRKKMCRKMIQSQKVILKFEKCDNMSRKIRISNYIEALSPQHSSNFGIIIFGTLSSFLIRGNTTFRDFACPPNADCKPGRASHVLQPFERSYRRGRRDEHDNNRTPRSRRRRRRVSRNFGRRHVTGNWAPIVPARRRYVSLLPLSFTCAEHLHLGISRVRWAAVRITRTHAYICILVGRMTTWGW